MYEKHPSLIQPADADVVWRYMDLGRFISLLSTSALFLARVDTLTDKWEGAYGSANQQLRESGAGPWPMELGRRVVGPTMYVSSWHVSPRESAAMWDIYQRDGRGVAVQTTWGNLTRSVTGSPSQVVGASVEYIDYSETVIPEDNLYYPYTRKRLSYEHEREARLILWSRAFENEHLRFASSAQPPLGVLVEADLKELIQKVFVAPDSPSWLVDVIKDVVNKYGRSFEVVHSDLFDGPLL